MYKYAASNLLRGMAFGGAVLLAGCGGNNAPTISGMNETYVEPALSILTINAVVEDLDDDPLTLTWSQSSGTPLWDEPPQGEQIQLKMPPDIGEDQNFEITLTVSDGTDEVVASSTIVVPTSFATNISDTSEDDGTSDIQDSTLSMSVPSLNNIGVLEKSKNEFSILFESDSGVTLDFSTVEIGLAAQETVTEIKDLFTYDEATGKLSVVSDQLESFYSLLGSDQNLLDISAYDSLGHDISKQVAFYFGFGEMQGVLRNSAGEPFTSLNGEVIELKGSFKTTTYTAVVDENAGFSFADLPADTYNMSMITEDFKIAAGSILINDENVTVSIDPTVVDLSSEEQIQPSAVPLQSLKKSEASLERLQYHEAVMAKKRAQALAEPAPNDLLGSVSVTSAAQGVAQTAKLNFEIPKEVTEIKVVATVVSQEYPDWTTIQSQYNDAWQYYFLVDGQIHTKQGNVNSTHASTLTVTYNETIQVNQDPNAAPAKVALFSSATNIGDEFVPTSVKIEVFESDQQLVISKLRHKQGLGLGKSGRWHLGVGSSSNKKWLADVSYTPVDAELSSAECSFKSAGNDIPVGDVSIALNGPGQAQLTMGFSGASVPVLGNTHGNISCDFEALNSAQEVIQTTQSTTMDFSSGKDTIIPLQRHSSGNRYGGRDIGSDDWMRARTRSYMAGAGSNLIYNDASREHGGCFVKDSFYSSYNTPGISCAKAIRDHASHRDGTSVDTLYPTSTHVNPRANLQTVLSQAATDPNAANEVKTWVEEARSNIESIAASSDVLLVYVAKVDWLKNLLVSGVDESGVLVPGLTAWTNKPAAVRHHKGHDNHIHIEFNN